MKEPRLGLAAAGFAYLRLVALPDVSDADPAPAYCIQVSEPYAPTRNAIGTYCNGNEHRWDSEMV